MTKCDHSNPYQKYVVIYWFVNRWRVDPVGTNRLKETVSGKFYQERYIEKDGRPDTLHYRGTVTTDMMRNNNRKNLVPVENFYQGINLRGLNRSNSHGTQRTTVGPTIRSGVHIKSSAWTPSLVPSFKIRYIFSSLIWSLRCPFHWDRLEIQIYKCSSRI